ncbi:hypothetical protein [Micromonospora sp. NPDC049274]|uniref:hypothetical protein n=1 Tax=Micromonospora sp. NPDC049274 TaxID=3154829 RepID=UPI0034345A76
MDRIQMEDELARIQSGGFSPMDEFGQLVRFAGRLRTSQHQDLVWEALVHAGRMRSSIADPALTSAYAIQRSAAHRRRGDDDEAIQWAELAHRTAQQTPDRLLEAKALRFLGRALEYRQPQAALGHHLAAYEVGMTDVSAAATDRVATNALWALRYASIVARRIDDIESFEHAQRLAGLITLSSDRHREILCGIRRQNGVRLRKLGRYEEARAVCEQLLHEFGDLPAARQSLLGDLGIATRLDGAVSLAQELAVERLAIADTLGKDTPRANALLELARVLNETGNRNEAKRRAEEAAELFQRSGGRTGLTWSEAAIADAVEDPTVAAQHLLRAYLLAPDDHSRADLLRRLVMTLPCSPLRLALGELAVEHARVTAGTRRLGRALHAYGVALNECRAEGQDVGNRSAAVILETSCELLPPDRFPNYGPQAMAALARAVAEEGNDPDRALELAISAVAGYDRARRRLTVPADRSRILALRRSDFLYALRLAVNVGRFMESAMVIEASRSDLLATLMLTGADELPAEIAAIYQRLTEAAPRADSVGGGGVRHWRRRRPGRRATSDAEPRRQRDIGSGRPDGRRAAGFGDCSLPCLPSGPRAGPARCRHSGRPARLPGRSALPAAGRR